jgi:hypothetical protein
VDRCGGVPFPDLSVNHQCRNFDAPVKWRKENSVNLETYKTLVKPKGIKQAKQQHMYFEVFPERTRPGTT